MKAKIIELSKESAGDGYKVLLNCKGKTHTARLRPHETDRLLAHGKFEEVQKGIYRLSGKEPLQTMADDLKKLVVRDYGKEALYGDIDNWIRYVTLSIDENYLPSSQYFDLLFFLYQLRDILNPNQSCKV